MKTQKTLFVILLMLIIHPTLTFGQIYAPEGLNMPGGWDGWSNPPTNPVFAGEAQSDHGELKLVELGLTAMYQTTFEVAADGDVAAGDYEFKFTSGPTNNYWANGWGSVNVISNTLQEYQLSGGNNSITLTDQKWYVMNWENKGYENTNAIFMELESQPAGFQSVSHAPEVPDPSEQITVNVETDIEPGTAQNVYVRYTDNDWTTSSLEEVSFTGTSGEATLAGFPVNSMIEYYVFSTNQENPAQDIDLKTIRFDNNGGDNYTIAVSDEYTLTFSVTDGTSPVEGAIVDVNDTQLTSDASGEATINLLNGDYPYTVMADGFVNATGTVTVDGSDVTEDVVLEQAYDVTFNVDMSKVAVEDFDPATDAVYLSGSMFDWPEPGTDSNLEMTDPDDDMIYTLEAALAVGDYQYKHFILPEGIGASWEYGEWDGNNREFTVSDAPVTLDNIFGHFVTEFHVINESAENIEGATVEVNGESADTDASGLASFHLPPNDWDGYDYEVSAEGYSNALGNIMVPYQDVEEEVTLTEPTSFMVNFQISDSDNPVEGALISIDGNELTSDADGEASVELDNGNYDYTVTAAGFMDHQGSLTVDGSEVIEEVTLTVGHLVTFNVDMSEFGDFDPVNDAVYVTGTPFGWTEPGQNEDFMLQDPDEDLVYSLEKEVAVGEHDYKYFYIPDGYTGSGWDNGEWDGETDRGFTVTDAPLILNDIWGAFIAEFHVINESTENIEGATVEVNGASADTDASGLASFHLPPNDWDGYDYEVSAEGYSNALGNIMVPYQDLEEEVTLTEPTSFMVTFQISDSDNPVEGALISINGNELTSDADGEASVELDNGNYDYTVTADGFMDHQGSLTVDGSEVIEEVVLSVGYMVTFNIDMENFSRDFNPASDKVYISGSPFDWPEPGTDPELELFDENSDLVYTLTTEIATGTHEYKYFYVPDGVGSSWDYGEWDNEENRTLEVTDEPVIMEDSWDSFTIEFHVTNESDEDIEGASIDISGEMLSTNASGLASIVLPPDDTDGYDYEVSADGYSNAAGNIILDYEDKSEQVTLLAPAAYEVLFQVSDGDNPVEGALISIDGNELTSDADGEASIELDNGNYDYSVTADGFIDFEGSLTVEGSNITEEVNLSEGHLVTFNLDMSEFEDFDPVNDEVYISGDPFGWTEPGQNEDFKLQDPDDDLVYSLEKEVAVGDQEYKYFYIPDGYTGSGWDNGEWDGETNRNFTVADAPLTLNDIWGAFIAEFHVINESAENIEGATVEVNGESGDTDASGLASFHLPPNDWDGYDYEVSAEGYSNALGNIMVPYQDVEEEVTLTEPSIFTVTFSVTDGTDPVQGASIDINSTQLTTDAAGEATIDLDNGSYPYTVSADGFMNTNGEVVVNGGDVTEEVLLSEGYMVTFNLDMNDFAAGDFDPATDEVYISGSPFGWPEPGTNASLQLTDPDDDLVYTLETEVAAGSHEYKYFYVPGGTGSSWDYGEWGSEDNRTLEVTDSEIITDDVWGAFYVEFHVSNAADEDIEGATVSVEGEELTTNADGLAETTLPPDGATAYSYEVSASGYATATGTVLVDFADVFEEVTLFEPDQFMVNFFVDMSPAVESGEFDPDADAIYVSGSAFDWPEPGTDGELELLDPDGDMIYGLNQEIAVGNYEYKYFIVPEGAGSSWDYGEWDGEVNRTFDVTDDDLVLNDFWGNFEVEFHVTNTGGDDIEGATVVFNDEELLTDIAGFASTIAPPNTDAGYDYEVYAEGYANAFGNITVNYEDVLEEVVMTEPASYNVTFEVSDGDSPVEGAVIEINGDQLTTDASGIAAINLPNGNYPYTVTSEDFLTYEGTVTVNGADITEEVILFTGYPVTFNVDMTPALENTDFDPAADAVYVSGSLFDWPEPGSVTELKLTDADGDLIYTLDTIAETGTHEYKYFYVPDGAGSSWDYGEWQGGDNRSVEVVDEGIDLNDIWGNFTVEFHVVNESNQNIEGAMVSIAGQELTTDNNGMASTYLTPDATEGYDYEVSATGYLPASGNVLVDYQDIMEEVVLEAENTYSVTFVVSDGDSPIADAAVMLEGYGEQMTDAEGETVFEEVIPSDSIYFSVTTDDYLFYEDSVAVADQNITEFVTLIPTSLNSEVFKELKVYPNPVKEVLFIETHRNNIDLQIFNGNGKLVEQSIINGDESIPFHERKAGIYILKFVEEGNVKTIRIIKP